MTDFFLSLIWVDHPFLYICIKPMKIENAGNIIGIVQENAETCKNAGPAKTLRYNTYAANRDWRGGSPLFIYNQYFFHLKVT